MITGSVSGRQAVVPIAFRLPAHPVIEIEFVLDTGFIGFLTLPPDAVAALGLPFFYRMPANLADDSTIMVPVHTATILWHGEERDVEVLAMGKRPHLGTARGRRPGDGRTLVKPDPLTPPAA